MMSSGVNGAIRVSIPRSAKKTIENVKEITGKGHGDDEIYAMLKECSMDPNETVQRLLLLDTFHEVKRKRDKRKENLNKEPTESRWNPGGQARANRGSRGNYSSRYTSHDGDGGKSKAPLATAQEMKKNEIASVTSPITSVSNGPSGITSQSTNAIHENSNATGNATMEKLDGPLPISSPVNSVKKTTAPGTQDKHHHQVVDSSKYTSVKGKVGNQRTPAEVMSDNRIDSKPIAARISASEVESSNLHQKIQPLESLQTVSSTIGVSSVSRPSSNYNNRSQVIGPQKVGAGKEWKPKSTGPIIGQSATSAAVSPAVSTVPALSDPESQPTPTVPTSKEPTLELQRKLEESHISDTQHVIIPNHLHVPESEKLWFCFGSFDASFGLDKSHNGGHESDESQQLDESHEAIDEPVKELPLSNQNAFVSVEDTEIKCPDRPESPTQGPENLPSSKGEVHYSESKQEEVQTSSNDNSGFMPPLLSGQLASYESSESQTREAPRIPGFVMQPSFDPTNYYAQFYRSSMDSDGRIPPFHPSGAANKYNGNTAMTSQEGGVPLVYSDSPTPLSTRAPGVIHNSITPTQPPPLPIFRHPSGVHIPHYPPNYIPYAPYFSPFYVQPQSIHQFLSNSAFPQQLPAGGVYPTAKYPVSQQKQGPNNNNTGTSTHMGSYGGQYGLSMANFNPSSATSAVLSSTDNEDRVVTQGKENNSYVSGQQDEGSGVWFTAPGRDISTLQASPFYNLPPGQLAFTQTHPSQGPFYHHPAQTVTSAPVHPLLQQAQAITSSVDMVGQAPPHVYQQQQTQLNWPSNY